MKDAAPVVGLLFSSGFMLTFAARLNGPCPYDCRAC